jgi:predicted AAA+ superfamily ATPase
MILESTILKVIEQQKNQFSRKDSGLKRELVPHTKSLSSHALVISGIRRCGKSTLLMQMIQSLNLEPLLFLNFDTPQLYGFSLNDFNRLDNIIRNEGSETLFFDEIQLVDGWEIYVRQKLDEGYKVIATGSNASMLGRELGTHLTGRYLTQELFPFSYTEFLRFRNLEPSMENLEMYMQDGGFPEYLKSGDVEQIIALYNDILIRDIVARHGVKDSMSLHRLANFLIANVGNKITATKLRQPLSIGATSTILSWFSHLESSYLFSFMPMFSYSSKAQLINPRKIFLIDPALINILSGSKTEDKGRKLENLVFLHLRRNFSELYYYNEKAECDFVAFKNGKLVGLIQVCFNLDQDNVSREINGLLSAMKFFNVRTGVIVTMADTDRIVKDGCTIEVIPAFRFMGTAFGDNDRQPQV